MIFNQKMQLFLDGLKVKLKKMTGRIKSRGMKPKAPISALTSPKNGSKAAIVVAIIAEMDLEITLDVTLLRENGLEFESTNIFSRSIFAGCKYTIAKGPVPGGCNTEES